MSPRNQLAGTVTEIVKGAVMAKVKVDIGGGNVIAAAIFSESVEDLGLEVGAKVTAVIKSTDVMIFRP